ncbi:MAG: hypothetical protein ABL994_13035 [Verrucomicrobiales bacterium]
MVALSLTPVGMVELMEYQLMEQFKGEATTLAQNSAAKLIIKGETIAYGTIINGRDQRFSYLVCPAEVVQSSNFIVETQKGALLQPVSGASFQLLSDPDNLAMIRLPRVEGVLSIKSPLQESSIGAFVGILSTEQKWKVGAVTNSTRSAFNGIPAATQKALSKHWERIGLKVNQKRSGYPEVIESDLALDPAQAGSPVFDRAGKWHGVAIARVDQHSTLVIPSKRVSNLVAEFELVHHQ